MTGELDLLLGTRIRRHRRRLGMTQADLAERVGIRPQQVQKYECAANKMSVARFMQIARALDVQPAALLEGLG